MSQVIMFDSYRKHAICLNAQCGQMFSCVQEPPLPPTVIERFWHGRQVGTAREETTICIKGVPGKFIVDQPEYAGSDKALCLVNDQELFAAHHHEPCSMPQRLPSEVTPPSTNQASGMDNETAKCQRAVTNLFDVLHYRDAMETSSFSKIPLPLSEEILDIMRDILAEEANPQFANEVIKYWQEETDKLLARDVKEADLFYDVCGCKRLDSETRKYIKCTVFTALSESQEKLPGLDQLSVDETPD